MRVQGRGNMSVQDCGNMRVKGRGNMRVAGVSMTLFFKDKALAFYSHLCCNRMLSKMVSSIADIY